MKLLIILSVIACSYADKLDRTYLPPASAATAGGSPGSIAAPGSETEIGLPKDTSPFAKPPGSLFGQSTGSSANQPTGTPFGQGPNQPGLTQPGQFGAGPAGSQYNQAGPQSGSSQFEQPGVSQPGSQYNQNGPQSGSPQFGQPGTGQPSSQYNQAGPQSGSPQFGQLGSSPAGSLNNQAGSQSTSPQYGQPGFSRPASQYNQNSPQSGSSQFGQTGASPAGSANNQAGPQSGSPQFGRPGAVRPNSPYNQNGPQSSQPQFGQLGAGPTDSSNNEDGSLSGSPQFGQPGASQPGSQYNQDGPQSGSPQFGQPGAGRPGASQSGSPQFGQQGAGPTGSPQSGSPQFGQPGSPGFGQPAGFNKSPAFGGQRQEVPAYSRPNLPERARASIDRNAEILHYENDIDGDSFAYSFETSNGIAADEAGIATNGVRAKGGFSYTGDDGQFYSVRYTADENGYVPQGDHLPTPHPIPEEILKSLEENARAAAAGTQEGAYNPNEDSGLHNGATYPGQRRPSQASPGYRPGQGPASQFGFPGAFTGTARPQGSQGTTPSYSGLGSSSQPQRGPGAGSPQYGSPESSPSSSPGLGSSTSALRPGSPSFGTNIGGQNGNKPDSGYKYPDSTIDRRPSGPGSQRLPAEGSQSPSSQFSAPGTARPGSPDFPSQGSQSSFPQKVSSFGQSSGLKPGFPKQTDQSPASPFNTPGSPSFGSTGLSGPQRFSSQYGRPGTSSNNAGLPRPGFPSQETKYQAYAPGSSPSTSGRPNLPGFPSQGGSSPTSQYKGPTGSPFGSQGNPNQDSQSPISQYNKPGTSSLGARFPSQSNQPGYQYNTPGVIPSNERPGFQRFPSQIGSSPFNQHGTSTGSPSTLSSGQKGFPTESPTGLPTSESNDIQSPNSQYGTPGVSPFGTTRPGSQRFPSQNGLPTGSPSGTNAPFGTQGSLSGKFPGSEGSRPFDSQSPTSPFNAPGVTKPTESQGFPIISGQRYPSFTSSGVGKQPDQSQPGFSDRPQFVSTGPSSSAGSNLSGPNGQLSQGQDESGYKYSRPQNQVGGQQDGKFPNSPGSPLSQRPIFGSNPVVQPTDAAGDHYNAPASTGSAPNATPNVSGFPKFPGSANQGYPSGSTSSVSSPDANSQRPSFTRPGQYTPAGNNVTPTSPTYARPGSTVGSFGAAPQSGQTSGSKPFMLNSAPYQYNRPGFQGSLSESDKPAFGSSGLERPGTSSSFGPSGLNRPDQEGTQTDNSFLGKERPGQTESESGFPANKPGQDGYQPGFGSTEQERPGQASNKPNYGSSGLNKPSQVGSQSGLGFLGQSRPVSSGQKKPGQIGYQQTFGSAAQKRPGQGSSQPDISPLGQNRPGQVNYQPGFDSAEQKKPTQAGSQPGFGPSRQERPEQVGYEPSFGTTEQRRPGQSGYRPSEQNKPGKTGSQPGYGPSRQDRPGQTVKGCVQCGLGITGQNRPTSAIGVLGQIRPEKFVSQSNFGPSGSEKPGQTDFKPGFGTSGQDRPGQLSQGKPAEDFSGPRQPPSFSKEEGYKY